LSLMVARFAPMPASHTTMSARRRVKQRAFRYTSLKIAGSVSTFSRAARLNHHKQLPLRPFGARHDFRSLAHRLGRSIPSICLRCGHRGSHRVHNLARTWSDGNGSCCGRAGAIPPHVVQGSVVGFFGRQLDRTIGIEQPQFGSSLGRRDCRPQRRQKLQRGFRARHLRWRVRVVQWRRLRPRRLLRRIGNQADFDHRLR